MICALIGDRMVDHLKEDQLERQLRELIEQEHISMFIFGYFGLFERSALRVIKRLQRDYPLLDYAVMLTGRKKAYPSEPEIDYLHAFYPQKSWLFPGQFGLLLKYRALASAADAVVFFNGKRKTIAANWICQATQRKRLYDLTLE